MNMVGAVNVIFRVLQLFVVTLLVGSVTGGSVLAQRLPVEARQGMVASAHVLASQAGVDVLKAGGNAVDAAVTVALSLAVVYPRAGNLGGGGFMVIVLADGRSTAIDFRETAPRAASATMYLDTKGEVVPNRSTMGYLASGTPGTVAGLALAKQRYGAATLSWSQLVEPARQLAANGFVISPTLARDLKQSEQLLAPFPESKRIFLREGKFFTAGERFVQADLARTLERVQRGWEDFYSGETARLIVEDMAAHGGLITKEDLETYRPVERPLLRGSYRGYTLLTMPPPSSGGITLLQMLGMLEPFDVDGLGYNSAAKIHLFAEVMRRAFRDRAEFPGDPAFVKVPVRGLLDPAYLRTRMADFNPETATPSEGLAAGSPAGGESTETTHFSVADSEGNVVSCTYTLNGLFGSGVTVPGIGVLLNNEMDDFTSKIGAKNLYGLIQGSANAIAPHKRPLSSMAPTVVLKDGHPILVTGSPGGSTISNTVLLVVTGVIDHHLRITQAVDAPRFHHQWQSDVINYEPFFTSPDSMALLRARGHMLAPRQLYSNESESAARYWGDAESIAIDPDTHTFYGANDLRNPTSAAVGY